MRLVFNISRQWISYSYLLSLHKVTNYCRVEILLPVLKRVGLICNQDKLKIKALKMCNLKQGLDNAESGFGDYPVLEYDVNCENTNVHILCYFHTFLSWVKMNLLSMYGSS